MHHHETGIVVKEGTYNLMQTKSVNYIFRALSEQLTLAINLV